MPRRGSPYGPDYERARARLLAVSGRCHICGRLSADSADHTPALALHVHVEGSGCCVLRPAHLSCNQRRGGWRVAMQARRLLGRSLPRPSRRW